MAMTVPFGSPAPVHDDSESATSHATAAERRHTTVPDFIIGGAPKCGTTTLHYVLDHHPDIGLPGGEVFFFDADDPITHPGFFHATADRLEWKDPCSPEAVAWYRSRFADFAGKRLIGEDTTTYLMSEVAPSRIQSLMPDVKLIFMLRHPVKRAFSQYWHLVNSGRLSVRFERAIADHPHIVLGSTYMSGLKRFLDHFPREQVKVVFFEDLIGDMDASIGDIAGYLGIDPAPFSNADTWHNRTYYPASPALHRTFNVVGRHLVRGRYYDYMRLPERKSSRFVRAVPQLYMRAMHRLLPTVERSPVMSRDAREFLTAHLTARNEGLSKLLGRDLTAIWPDMPI